MYTGLLNSKLKGVYFNSFQTIVLLTQTNLDLFKNLGRLKTLFVAIETLRRLFILLGKNKGTIILI